MKSCHVRFALYLIARMLPYPFQLDSGAFRRFLFNIMPSSYVSQKTSRFLLLPLPSSPFVFPSPRENDRRAKVSRIRKVCQLHDCPRHPIAVNPRHGLATKLDQMSDKPRRYSPFLPHEKDNPQCRCHIHKAELRLPSCLERVS